MMDKDTIILSLLVAILISHLMPRPIRRGVARLIFWQWKKMSHLSAVVYWWLYQRVNGNGGDRS